MEGALAARAKAAACKANRSGREVQLFPALIATGQRVSPHPVACCTGRRRKWLEQGCIAHPLTIPPLKP